MRIRGIYLGVCGVCFSTGLVVISTLVTMLEHVIWIKAA